MASGETIIAPLLRPSLRPVLRPSLQASRSGQTITGPRGPMRAHSQWRIERHLSTRVSIFLHTIPPKDFTLSGSRLTIYSCQEAGERSRPSSSRLRPRSLASRPSWRQPRPKNLGWSSNRLVAVPNHHLTFGSSLMGQESGGGDVLAKSSIGLRPPLARLLSRRAPNNRSRRSPLPKEKPTNPLTQRLGRADEVDNRDGNDDNVEDDNNNGDDERKDDDEAEQAGVVILPSRQTVTATFRQSSMHYRPLLLRGLHRIHVVCPFSSFYLREAARYAVLGMSPVFGSARHPHLPGR